MRDYPKQETGSVVPQASLGSLINAYDELLAYNAELLSRLQTVTYRIVGDDEGLKKELDHLNSQFNQPSPKETSYCLISHLTRLVNNGSFNNSTLGLLINKLNDSI